jgi:hypothetical protein
MTLVIANVKLLLDQVSYAGTGPQRSLIAQALGTCDQQLLQLLLLFLTQARLAAGASRFAERGLALGTILVHPTSHRLPDHAELPSNLRLAQSALPHLNGLKASFL